MEIRRPKNEAERLEEYFRQLQYLIPCPPPDWQKKAKECKWAKILKEQSLILKSEEAMAEDKSKYTKPDLRERIKNKVMREGRGGKPGEWS